MMAITPTTNVNIKYIIFKFWFSGEYKKVILVSSLEIFI